MNDVLLKELELFTIDNEYRHKMLKLIELNQSAPKRKVLGRELHHICPKFYWKWANKKISNDDWNLVSFSGADHLLCHYYLYECIIPELKSKAMAPINILKRYLHKKFVINEENILAIKDIIDLKGGAALGTKWYHNPETGEAIMSKRCPKGFVEGRGILKPNGPTQLRNKEVQYKRSKCINPNNTESEIKFRNRLENEGCCEEAVDWYMENLYYSDTLGHSLKFALCAIDLVGMLLEHCDEKDFSTYYSILMSTSIDAKYFTRHLWYNNGKLNIKISPIDVGLNNIPEGFYPGRLWDSPLAGKKGSFLGKKHTEEQKKKISESNKGKNKGKYKGMKWFNNGQISKRCFECPEGFVPGMLR